MATLSGQLSQLQKQAIAPQKTVVCIEWIDPLMAAGNWVPELVALAGGKELLGNLGQHSGWLTWEQLQSADPDVLIVMPCGFDLAATHQAVKTLALDKRWHTLKAVRDQQVFLTDGNQYFNRPGPR
jgi:iron complex transport system substrate-binding protein